MMSNKYIPPHRRHIIDFPRGSKINVKDISEKTNNKITAAEKIEKVDTVNNPIIVEPPNLGQSHYKDAIIAGLKAEMEESIPVEIEVEPPKWEPSQKDIQLFKDLAVMRRNRRERLRKEKFDRWLQDYYNDLNIMYKNYVDPKLGITFKEFVEAAFLCSEVDHNGKLLHDDV